MIATFISWLSVLFCLSLLSPVAYPPSAAISLSLLFQHLRPYWLVPHSLPPLLMRLVGSFIWTFLAPRRQSIFVAASFIKVTLGLPALAPSTSLLFHPVNNSMTLLISIILFQALPLFLVTLSHICPHAVFAIIPQSVFTLRSQSRRELGNKGRVVIALGLFLAVQPQLQPSQ